MNLNYEAEHLEKLNFHFKNITGISIDITDTNFHPLFYKKVDLNPFCTLIQCCENGKSRCYHSDTVLMKKCRETKKLQRHVCHAGLIDIAVPLFDENSIIAYVILGQLKDKIQFEEIESCISDLPIEKDSLREAYNSLLCVDETKIESAAEIATVIAKYLIYENMLRPFKHNTIKSITNFIDEHIEEPLRIKYISQKLHISQSNLYKIFHKYFNCTVSEYINAKRIEKAELLLIETSLTIEDISQKTGFSSASYFSNVFKNTHGMSPLKYRQKRRLIFNQSE